MLYRFQNYCERNHALRLVDEKGQIHTVPLDVEDDFMRCYPTVNFAGRYMEDHGQPYHLVAGSCRVPQILNEDDLFELRKQERKSWGDFDDTCRIIEIAVRGDLVKITLGAEDCTDYWGDDWNDRPYNCNAGNVYERYVVGVVTIRLPHPLHKLVPYHEYAQVLNCDVSMEDFKNRLHPYYLLCRENFSLTRYDSHPIPVYLGESLGEFKKKIGWTAAVETL